MNNGNLMLYRVEGDGILLKLPNGDTCVIKILPRNKYLVSAPTNIVISRASNEEADILIERLSKDQGGDI